MEQVWYSQAPDVPHLLRALETHKVRYILVGSVAASLYGVDLQPGDLDIAPALATRNLKNLTSLLLELEAKPSTSGHWEPQPDGEKRWKEDETALDVEKRTNWTPNPNEVASFDYLFFTRFGNFDVVPELANPFERLKERAVPVDAHGQEVRVAHPDDLLSTLTVPRRRKDTARVQQLREVQRLRAEG